MMHQRTGSMSISILLIATPPRRGGITISLRLALVSYVHASIMWRALSFSNFPPIYQVNLTGVNLRNVVNPGPQLFSQYVLPQVVPVFSSGVST